MARRTLHRPFFGSVPLAVAPESLIELCAAYQGRAGADEFFSHSTAARLLGLPLPGRVEREPAIHVSVAAPSFAPEVRGVVGHRLDQRPDVVLVDGLRVSNPIDVWLQLSSRLRIDDLVVLGDALVRRKKPITTLDTLDARVRGFSRRRGVLALREAASLVRARTESVAETQLRLALVAAGLPEPVVNDDVFDGARRIGAPDLAYPRARIAIEYEGEVHRLELATFRDDIERRERFEDAGWRVIRVTADHMKNTVALANRVRRALAART